MSRHIKPSVPMQEALKLDPDYLPSLKSCGRLLLKMREFSEALEKFDQILLPKRDWRVQFMRARCLQVRSATHLNQYDHMQNDTTPQQHA